MCVYLGMGFSVFLIWPMVDGVTGGRTDEWSPYRTAQYLRECVREGRINLIKRVQGWFSSSIRLLHTVR